MTLSVDVDVKVEGDRSLFGRASEALRNPRPLLKQIGVLGMSSALGRLPQVLKQDANGVRSGRLTASIASGLSGFGGGDTVFDLSDTHVVVGSNLPYAAQVNYGGTIFPRNAKALAIPLTPQLQRLGIGPRELPDGALRFQPTSGGKPNVFAVLIDDEGLAGFGTGALFALAKWVTQQPRPFLYFDEEDIRVINDELWPGHLDRVA